MLISDSDAEVLAGRIAGVGTGGATYGFEAQTLELVPPDVLLADLREMVRTAERAFRPPTTKS